jgi:thiol-disulfide isomerase/thioredoxin
MLLKENMMLRSNAAIFLFFLLCLPLKQFGQNQEDQKQVVFPTDAIVQFKTYEDLEGLLKNENPDKIKIINFWATWCKPCVRELSLFELYSQKNKQYAEVYLISLDRFDDINKLAEFLGRREITTHVGMLLDKNYNEWIGKVDANWSGAIPATLIISNGQKYFFEQEFENYFALESVIEKSLNASK